MPGILAANIDSAHHCAYCVDDRHLSVVPLIQPTESAPERGRIKGPTDDPRLLELSEIVGGGVEGADVIVDEQDPDPSPDGGAPAGPIVLRTVWQEAKGRVRLSVLDSGTGFADAILKRAFEPYVTTKIKGTGLGLAVVKKIADEHGSRVDLSNRTVDGQVVGAQVSLSLPVVNSSQV